jgi:two-component system chemotaxis sensor kinase CheA
MSDPGALQAELLGAFFEESFEGIEKLEAGLLRLDRGVVESDNVNEIFRAAHSLKGAAGTFGFGFITELAHVMETVLDQVRSLTLAPSPAITALLLEAVDCLRGTLDCLRGGGEPETERLDDLARRINQIETPGKNGKGAGQDRGKSPAVAAPAGAGWRIDFRPHVGLLRTGNEPGRLLRELERMGPVTVKADLSRLPSLHGITSDDCYLSWTIDLAGDVARSAIDEVFAWVTGDCDLVVAPLIAATAGTPVVEAAVIKGEASDNGALASIRISIDKVDLLMNMVGELVITQSMLGEIDEDKPLDSARVGRIRQGLSQLSRNSRALQESVMRLRSMPISVLFNRFPRLVHDLSRQLGKKIELRQSGQNTELDKTVLEKLGDPLVHLVRNCLDHGFETPAERVAQGKPEVGTLTLSAFHRGGDIVVEVADDGRGLDPVRIVAKARERGLIAPGHQPSLAEAHELIFAPGFSTAAAVSDLSGRGVGMDVVRRNVRGLGGEVTVTSEVGTGTRISLRLPLTLAIIDGQLVRVGAHPFVVPLLAIVESVQIEPAKVKHLAGRHDVYRLRDDLVPMLSLARLLGGVPAEGSTPGGDLMVVVEGDGRPVGLLVDEILGLQQVVVKSLEANYERVAGLAGATILGDGGVAFILDVAGLAKLMRPGQEQEAAAF